MKEVETLKPIIQGSTTARYMFRHAISHANVVKQGLLPLEQQFQPLDDPMMTLDPFL